jgi:hypothetical protein
MEGWAVAMRGKGRGELILAVMWHDAVVHGWPTGSDDRSRGGLKGTLS